MIDETISDWGSHKTDTGGFSHTHIIERKTEPLDTDFNNLACLKKGLRFVLIFIEVIRSHIMLNIHIYPNKLLLSSFLWGLCLLCKFFPPLPYIP